MVEEEKVIHEGGTDHHTSTSVPPQEPAEGPSPFILIKDPLTGKVIRAPADQKERLAWLRERYEQFLKAEQEEIQKTVEDVKELERMALSVLVSVCKRPSRAKDRNRISAARAILDYIKGRVPTVESKLPAWEEIIKAAQQGEKP